MTTKKSHRFCSSSAKDHLFKSNEPKFNSIPSCSYCSELFDLVYISASSIDLLTYLNRTRNGWSEEFILSFVVVFFLSWPCFPLALPQHFDISEQLTFLIHLVQIFRVSKGENWSHKLYLSLYFLSLSLHWHRSQTKSVCFFVGFVMKITFSDLTKKGRRIRQSAICYLFFCVCDKV